MQIFLLLQMTSSQIQQDLQLEQQVFQFLLFLNELSGQNLLPVAYITEIDVRVIAMNQEAIALIQDFLPYLHFIQLENHQVFQMMEFQEKHYY